MSATDPVTVLCEICGTPTPNRSIQRCENCRQVEQRLPEYIKNPKGMAFARKAMPVLDDWADQHPDAWDYDAVLTKNEVSVEWSDTVVDGEGNKSPAGEYAGWGFGWKHGGIHIGQTTETIARKAAALFVSLWLRGVSASFADKLMAGFINFLELQENTSLTFLVETGLYSHGGPFMRLTRKGFCTRASFEYDVERKILEALDPQPDEEVIVTFTKRKKCPQT